MTEAYTCRSCGHAVKAGEHHITWNEAVAARERREKKRQTNCAPLLRTGLKQRIAGLFPKLFRHNIKVTEAQ